MPRTTIVMAAAASRPETAYVPRVAGPFIAGSFAGYAASLRIAAKPNRARRVTSMVIPHPESVGIRAAPHPAKVIGASLVTDTSVFARARPM